MTTDGFVPLRRGILEHVADELIGTAELAMFCRLLLKADYRTGVVYVRINEFIDTDVNYRRAKRAFHNLEARGYIRALNRAMGSHKKFPVLINKFERKAVTCTPDGPEYERLNALESSSLEDLVWETVLEESANGTRRGSERDMKGTREGHEGDMTSRQTYETKEVTLPKQLTSTNNTKHETKNKRQGENLMKASKEIPVICRRLLKVEPEKNQYSWSKLKELEEIYGGFHLVRVFTAWAERHELEDMRAPLAAFLRVAEDLLSQDSVEVSADAGRPGSASGSHISELDRLCVDLLRVGRQGFGDKLRGGIEKLLTKFSAAEILDAWKDYTAPMDENDLKYAPKKFVSGIAQDTILLRRDEATKRAAQDILQNQLLQNEQRKAAEELEAIRQAEELEIEEPLS
jgi:hypothetical protein